MTAAHPRPRIVDVAFWSWLAGAVLLILGGLLALTTRFDTVRRAAAAGVSDEQIHAFLAFYRGAGAICIFLGVAIGYLAGRTRSGDKRFRRAAVALSLVGAAVLAVGAFVQIVTLPSLLAMIALIVGAGMVTRPAASAWFDAMQQPEPGNA
ncbi:MAG: hypothetical protein JO044_07305 [Mycobacteriaceae bacterium]|nr:hypothetical protein [Mycobacteriaceae bacterium]MBV9641799.1 hypothetical protein [Mycobacteriaceae bacterium]